MNSTKNSIARFSTAAAIAVIFTVSACGGEQASSPAPAQQVTVERDWPAKHMNRPHPVDSGQESQQVAEHVHSFMRGKGRPDSNS
jgi:hypothetical protein